MYRGFNLKIERGQFSIMFEEEIPVMFGAKKNQNGKGYLERININQFSAMQNEGKEEIFYFEQNVNPTLKKYILCDDMLNGATIQKEWFPEIECDVFISHSHKDKDLAIAFAGWLHKQFGLKAFVDSCVWGCVDELQQEIDDRYCKINGTNSYSYKQRNSATSHVHLILMMALLQMIDNAECLFFLNTPNSVILEDIAAGTFSPWIYAEIGMSRLINTLEHFDLTN